MTIIRDIDLNVFPSHEESPNNNDKVFLRNNFDLNNDMNYKGEFSSQVNGETQLRFDLNASPPIEELVNFDATELYRDTGEEVVQENVSEGEIRLGKNNLSNAQRRAIYHALLKKSVDGKLKRDITKIVATLCFVPIRYVQRIWKQAKDNFVGGVADVSYRRLKNCGHKRIQINMERIQEVNLYDWTTFRCLACATKYNKSSLHIFYRSGGIRRHSNAIKPYLKEDNMKSRLQFCISILDISSLPHDPIFVDMYNIVHIDEKWFFMMKKSEKYLLLSDEEDPLRICKSKNFIVKVMFLVAIARPRFDVQGNELFSEKIEIFPFITREPAKRTSANRIAGTIETKSMNSVGKDMVRSFLIEKILLAIRAKWPSEDSKKPIFIQQNNARTHTSPNDEKFHNAASQDDLDIRLICQPPNSPNMNVLDLGFFCDIQSFQYQEPSKNIDELIAAVNKSFEAISTIKSNRIFLSLQLCMIETMKVQGSSKYKIPHYQKQKLEKEGRLPIQMKCDPELVQDVLNNLN